MNSMSISYLEKIVLDILTRSSPNPFVTPGRYRGSFAPGIGRLATSNLGALAGPLTSKGLNRSLIPCSALLRWILFLVAAPESAFLFFCFLDCGGPTTPLSRRDDFSCFSCEGAIVAFSIESSVGGLKLSVASQICFVDIDNLIKNILHRLRGVTYCRFVSDSSPSATLATKVRKSKPKASNPGLPGAMTSL